MYRNRCSDTIPNDIFQCKLHASSQIKALASGYHCRRCVCTLRHRARVYISDVEFVRSLTQTRASDACAQSNRAAIVCPSEPHNDHKLCIVTAAGGFAPLVLHLRTKTTLPNGNKERVRACGRPFVPRITTYHRNSHGKVHWQV